MNEQQLIKLAERMTGMFGTTVYYAHVEGLALNTNPETLL